MLRQTTLTGLALAAVMLAACGAPGSGGGPQPLVPTARWQLRVEPTLDRIALAVHETGLSARQQAALRDLASRYAAEGAPEV
ncbi:CpaD family pilus assembly lipoprotein, partial [Brevundimonas sp.]|uniref:CpaD family pilus assembly lipoprotein n=1 Tax=Brevundimonas sp. TaxID=1871086 RepID=UPI0025F713E4